MNRIIRRLGLGLVACGLLAAPAAAQGLNIGDRAPDFTLPGTDGQTHTLSDLKGQWVVLAWFPKAFTGG